MTRTYVSSCFPTFSYFFRVNANIKKYEWQKPAAEKRIHIFWILSDQRFCVKLNCKSVVKLINTAVWEKREPLFPKQTNKENSQK